MLDGGWEALLFLFTRLCVLHIAYLYFSRTQRPLCLGYYMYREEEDKSLPRMSCDPEQRKRRRRNGDQMVVHGVTSWPLIHLEKEPGFET